MGLDWQISFASRTLYFVAVVSAIHLLTRGSMLATWMLGSGIVDVGSAYVLGGSPLLGYFLEVLAIATFFALGHFVAQRYSWAMQGALTFLTADCIALFDKVAAIGAPASGIGLASFLVVFHGIVMWCVFRAARASRQYRVNSAILQRIQFETELKRRLAESDDPPPPAAKFETRFRGITPSGPASPPQPQG